MQWMKSCVMKRKRVLEHARRHRVARHECGLAGRSQEIDGRSAAGIKQRPALQAPGYCATAKGRMTRCNDGNEGLLNLYLV
jgi:hypothetical protein